jgi:hypothetical protein
MGLSDGALWRSHFYDISHVIVVEVGEGGLFKCSLDGLIWLTGLFRIGWLLDRPSVGGD